MAALFIYIWNGSDEMALLDSIKLRIGIEDTKQDDLITDIIADVQARVLAYINQDGLIQSELPSGLDFLIKDITIRIYNKIGDEGKESSSEGNVSNTWDTPADLSEYSDVLDVYRKSYKRRSAGMRFV